MNLVMISGKSAAETARGKKNAFFYTLQELKKYFDSIDVIQFDSPLPNKHFDVMTVHEYAPFRNGRVARKIWETKKIPMIFEIMHIPGVPRAGSWREYVARLMTRWYIKHDTRQAVAVRVINKQVGKWLVDSGVPESKIKLIPAMYIDFEIFKPMHLEKKYDMIFVGRRAANKGIGLFLKAINKLQITNYKIVDGWAKDSHEVATLINESKILVMPSYNEGGPRVVLEALACGVPVLATPVGIVPEVLSPEFIIDWSADDIAEKAKKILDGKLMFMAPDLSRFEKKSAIKNYAEEIIKVINT